MPDADSNSTAPRENRSAPAWVLNVTAGPIDTYIIVTFSRNLPVSTFTMSITVATAGGQVSGPGDVATSVLNAQTGDVQVSVTWNTASDVDLHVVEPSGERIYWSSCGVSETRYVVTVNNGGSQNVFTGTFTGSDTDEPRVITSFVRSSGLVSMAATPWTHLRALLEPKRSKWE